MISRRDSESLRRRAAERWNESEKEAGVTTADTEAEKRSRAHRTWLQATKVVDTVPTNPCVAYFSGRQYSPEGVPPQEEISSPKDARRPQRLPVRVLSNLVELIQRDDARVLALAREISAMGSGRLVQDELHVASHDHVQNDEGILELESEPRAGIVVDDRFANVEPRACNLNFGTLAATGLGPLPISNHHLHRNRHPPLHSSSVIYLPQKYPPPPTRPPPPIPEDSNIYTEFCRGFGHIANNEPSHGE
ncbi:hypothetical protein WAI453_012242 [Rhynchosporium graminicola]